MSADTSHEWRYREAYSAPATLLPELVMIGHDRFPAARRLGLDEHRHQDAFEICYFMDGRVHWQVGGVVYTVCRGDLFVTLPDEPHGGVDAVMEPCEIYWAQVRFGQDSLPLPQAKALEQQLRQAAERRAFAASAPERIAAAFDTLIGEHRRGDDCPLTVTAARAALHLLLVTVARDADGTARTPEQIMVSSPIARALDWMRSQLGESFSIESAASVAGIAPSAFYERFVREVGLTPADWRTRQRIEQAKSWLLQEPDRSVTEIALALGFRSSQYFATTFRKYTARTPSEYRQSLKDTKSPHCFRGTEVPRSLKQPSSRTEMR